MLALATCYCNDLYREAAKLGVQLEHVEVEASADFPGVGLAATNIAYCAKVSSPAPEATIAKLLSQTDAVAEVHNTLRAVLRSGTNADKRLVPKMEPHWEFRGDDHRAQLQILTFRPLTSADVPMLHEWLQAAACC